MGSRGIYGPGASKTSPVERGSGLLNTPGILLPQQAVPRLIYYRNKHRISDTLRTSLGQLTSYKHSGVNKTRGAGRVGVPAGLSPMAVTMGLTVQTFLLLVLSLWALFAG